ncbi:MAG: DNA replication and repair protein RecF [Synergistaceae bacterium]|nr:DNA replication and repair protein RecF [Synergistaceae bacterium]
MGFQSVRFGNFRNLESREMSWSPGLNLLTGVNGSGKTNILEGINIISGWGPLERGTKTVSLPTWKSGSADVWLTGKLDTEYAEIIKVKVSGRFIIKIDEKTISATDLRWKVPVLTFLPNDMAILEDSASYRRRLLDMLLALLVPPYAMRLHDYRRGVRQKAFLLKNVSPTDIIDRVLLPLAAWIWKMREEAVQLLSECLNGSGLLPAKVSLSLKRGGAGCFYDYNDDYRRSVSMNRERELAVKMPMVGPHRDDMLIMCEEKLAAEALSRGFRRRVAIALMLAAADGVKRKLGRDPVLLLDEVTAELDAEGREMLFRSLLERETQVFAATAEENGNIFPGAVYKVSEGSVTQVK